MVAFWRSLSLLGCLACVKTVAAGVAPRADLETTVALSPSAFWKLAMSEEFYRSTRMPSRNVNQRVVRVTGWVSPDGKRHEGSNDKVELTSARRSGYGAAPLSGLFAPPTPNDQQLQRQAHLAYDITSPFGSSQAKAVQSIALGLQDGTITYTEASCVSGFPMMSGDLKGKTTWAVTPSADDPDRCMVRVAVSVDDVVLPFAARWLSGRIGKMMRQDLIMAAKKYLDAMAEAEAQGVYKASESYLTSPMYA